MVISLFKALLKVARDWSRERLARHAKKKALSKYGWDCNCPGCKKLMHTEDTVVKFEETEWHWHYTCKCGFKSAWSLWAPVPMYDPSYVEKMVNAPDNY